MDTEPDPFDGYNERERAFIKRNDYLMARRLAVRRLHSQGYSLRKIGQAMGLSHERIRQLLAEK